MSFVNYKNLETPLLINKCSEKDPVAWSEFVRRYSGLILFSIKKVLKTQTHLSTDEDAKDLLQNILTNLWTKDKLTLVKNRKSINYWLSVIGRNTALDYLRKKKPDTLLEDKTYFDNVSKETATFDDEILKKVKSIYELLTPREALIVKLYFEKDIKSKDIAKILNLSIGNITATITRIKQKLRSKM